ncbi:mitochondrial carrier domain-containing protein [Phascolomyces articulosus]|uniref:Mitochondrial carrier domain-containing protein n=1 Tax=Phascolomyces articulosus TaxID=60185 RepID=A0AAD5PEH1_9FUNG|nr:mitochondrial carrier domain-containing protein [Phascolomyces articulosus]
MHGSDASRSEAGRKHFNIPSMALDADVNYPPYFDTIVAGAIGGASGDFLMHSVDTVKTRVQGQPHHRPLKYHNMVQAYRLIWKEEGVLRGLYAGITPAMLGSIPATTLYFSVYEATKRTLTGYHVPEVVSHLTAGSLGDLLASIFYVPSEVLKTRLQLQGRYNNPHFISGYNYRGTWHATKVIVKYDGFGALFHGFTATILRDVPYSALQFACYEQFKKFAKKQYNGEQLPIGIDLLTGSMAGGIAGAITTPLDLMKTLLQTQQTPKHYSGIIEGMVWNYKNHGLGGLFRGVGPRVFWTSLQSAVMFVIYEQVLHVEEKLRNRGDWPPTEVAAKLVPK